MSSSHALKMDYFNYLINPGNTSSQQKQLVKCITKQQYNYLKQFIEEMFNEKFELSEEDFKEISKRHCQDVLEFIDETAFTEGTIGLYLSQNFKPLKSIIEVALKYKTNKKKNIKKVKKEEEEENKESKEKEKPKKKENYEIHNETISGARGHMDESEKGQSSFEKYLSTDSGPSSPEFNSSTNESESETEEEEEEED